MSEPISFTLPSGRTVTLRIPTGADQERVLRRLMEEYKAEDNGAQRALLEHSDLLRAAVLLSDSGNANGAVDPDPRHAFEKWDLLDIRAYRVFFNELTSLTEDEEKAAKEAAKSVRARPGARA